MSQDLVFLDFSGLEDQLKNELLKFLCPLSKNPDVELPWDPFTERINPISKGDGTYLNVFAPAFQSAFISNSYIQKEVVQQSNTTCLNTYSNGVSNPMVATPNFMPTSVPKYHTSSVTSEVNTNSTYAFPNRFPNSKLESNTSHPNALAHNGSGERITDTQPRLPLNRPGSSFKLCPTVSSFIPQKLPAFMNHTNGVSASDKVDTLADSKASHELVTEKVSVNETIDIQTNKSTESNISNSSDNSNFTSDSTSNKSTLNPPRANGDSSLKNDTVAVQPVVPAQPVAVVPQPVAFTQQLSFADVLKAKNDKRTATVFSTVKIPVVKQQDLISITNSSETQEKKSCIKDDKIAIQLGRHLFDFKHEFSVTNLQPRGLINQRNWCYINATLQALLACSPFYNLLRDLPLGPGVERGNSSTPVVDSMVKLSYKFTKMKEEMEDLQPGTAFQPVPVYDMLGNLKSDCLRGQQEDAEEILSFILNGMHEEMVAVIKNYEDQHNLNANREIKSNGHVDESDAEDEWQVIGAKQRSMVTRKVIEHKTPISDMLGGQIKSILTTNGNKTSASVQPFFTLQLDIQSDAITTVEEALNQMTVKEPVQGYTCAKTKQEIEAYSRNMLQKLPPVLILHLKRFVYLKRWDGGCKKLMKHVQYPIDLEFKKELFTPEARKMKRPSSYKLFAVIYHDGSEAILGHYICDIYHFGSKCWLRCDDRNITTINEAQVLTHSPPRVPYLLFYQVCSPERFNGE